MHDDMQAMRLLQLDKCLRDGQFPCRWVPDMGYGYGYPQFVYYSPLPYYVMELFHLSGLSFLDSVKAGFALSFILSGLAMFLLGKSLWGKLGGLVSAIFYVYAPYRASDAFSRGAVGEFWALVFLPLIFWSVHEYVKTEKSKYLVFLALSYGSLLVTHNITSLAFTPFLALWSLFLLYLYKKWKLVLKLVPGGLWGIGLASFFLLPVIFEKKFAHTETMIMGYFNYLAHFVSLKQLFWSGHWGFGSSELGPNDDLSFSIGVLHWLFALVALVLFFIKERKEKIFKIASFLFLTGLIAVFMAHQRSVFIWNRLPFLEYFQFPWRFLTIVTFSFSSLAGALIYFVKSEANKKTLAFFLIVLGIFFNSFYFNPREWYDLSDEEKFSGELWQKQLTISIFDYLPIFAKMPPSSEAPGLPLVVQGQAEILDYQKGSNWQKGKIKVFSENSKIQIPSYYFPGFKVWVNGRETEIDYNNDLGLIRITLSRGENEVMLKLTKTLPRKAGDFLTLFSVGALIYFLFYEKNFFKRKS